MDATRPRPERPSSDEPPQVVVRSGGRVRAALRCPYCHDQVGRQDALACARGGCGALYHRECWEECARWDGCAALGCGSREAREVSALGYLVRLLRLVLAALLFPRRLARALRATERAGVTAIFRRALDAAWVLVPSNDASKNGPGKFMLHLLTAVPTLYLVFVLAEHADKDGPVAFLGAFLYMGLMLFAPFLVALVGTTGFYALRALALAFRSELAAFARQDDAIVREVRPSPKKDPAS